MTPFPESADGPQTAETSVNPKLAQSLPNLSKRKVRSEYRPASKQYCDIVAEFDAKFGEANRVRRVIRQWAATFASETCGEFRRDTVREAR